jgi:hypothetical protein
MPEQAIHLVLEVMMTMMVVGVVVAVSVMCTGRRVVQGKNVHLT